MKDYLKIIEILNPFLEYKYFEIFNINNDNIGCIEFYKPWNKYIFNPYFNTVWSIECLSQIIDFLKTL